MLNVFYVMHVLGDQELTILLWSFFLCFLLSLLPPYYYAISFSQLIQSTLCDALLNLEEAVCPLLTG